MHNCLVHLILRKRKHFRQKSYSTLPIDNKPALVQIMAWRPTIDQMYKQKYIFCICMIHIINATKSHAYFKLSLWSPRDCKGSEKAIYPWFSAEATQVTNVWPQFLPIMYVQLEWRWVSNQLPTLQKADADFWIGWKSSRWLPFSPVRRFSPRRKTRRVSGHSGGRLNKKDGLARYGDSHVKDKTS